MLLEIIIPLFEAGWGGSFFSAPNQVHLRSFEQLIGHYTVVSLLLSRNPLVWPAISRQRTYGTNNERKVSILGKILLVEPIQSIQTALWEVGRVRHNKEKHTRLARERGTQKHMKKKDIKLATHKNI